MATYQKNPFLAGLILAAFVCIFSGIFLHKLQVTVIGFACIPIVGIFVFVQHFLVSKKSSIALESFSKSKTGSPPIKKCPAECAIPTVFYGQRGQIPFNNIKNVIRINSDFVIFHNSYWSVHRIVEGGCVRPNTRENQLNFFFSIPFVAAYHKIVLKHPATQVYSAALGMLTGKETPVVEVSDANIHDSFYVLSHNGTEAVKIVSLIKQPLVDLCRICNSMIATTIDGLPTNLEIHITDKYILARMNPSLGPEIEQLNNAFKNMQRLFPTMI